MKCTNAHAHVQQIPPARCDRTQRPSGSTRSPAAAWAFALADAQATHRLQAAHGPVRYRAMSRLCASAPLHRATPAAIRLGRVSWLRAHPTVYGSQRPRAASGAASQRAPVRVRVRVPWCRWISRASRAPTEDGRLAEVDWI